MLPAGEAVETVAGEQDLWTYAVASAALLHDLGKPIADQRVALFDVHGEPLGDWVPWIGPFPPKAAWYRMTFVHGRQYRLHEKLPALLARLIVPAAGLRWLGSNLGVLEAWLAAISGEHEAAGSLGEIVQQADRASVAADLTVRPVQMPTARTRPLHERLLTGLRFLLQEGHLPLNRRGAAGWLTQSDLWLVSKRVLDALREHLEQEGQGGIPSRNERLMDELQQHGVIAANGDKAIWTVEVTIDDWHQQLTTLRFPARIVWSDTHARPDPFAGTVAPPEGHPGAERANKAISTTGAETHPVSTGRVETRPASDRETNARTGAREVVIETRPSPPVQKDEPCAHTEGEEDGAGTRFVAWLRDGLRSERLSMNETNARVHTAAEGLLLVSPGIFKDFDPEDWSTVQKRFQRLKVHRKTARGTNIFTYQVQGARKRSRVKVYLVPDPARLLPGIKLPPPNAHLSLLE